MKTGRKTTTSTTSTATTTTSSTKGATVAAISAFTLALLAGGASAGVVHTTESGLTQTVNRWVVEDFEDKSGAVTTLTFGSEMSAPVVTKGVQENVVKTTTDGHGAWAYEGDRFWKLRAGATMLDLGGWYTGFGFWYSDLEGAQLDITFHGDTDVTVTLTDKNPNAHAFFGYSDVAGAFSAVTIEWASKSGDGIGLDRMMLGSYALPAPGAASLAIGLGLCAVRRTRRAL